MAKYDEKFKLKVVREVLRGACAVEAIATRRGLDYSMVRRWVDSFRQHGRAGLAKKLTRYDARFKQTVLERMRREGLSGRQAAAMFGIRNPGAIGLWQRQCDQGVWAHWRPPANEDPGWPRRSPRRPSPTKSSRAKNYLMRWRIRVRRSPT
jgi:transposase